MNKILLSFLLIFVVNIALPTQYNSSANAGVITWTAKKLIGGTIGLIFKVTSERLVEIQVDKLIHYLQKHPKYKQFAIKKVQEQITKHPKYKKKGYMLLNKILKIANDKFKI